MTIEQLIAAKERAHLPAGLACRVHYAGSVVDVPAGKDWAEVCNAVRAKVFGGAVLARDAKFDARVARRKARTMRCTCPGLL